jgi:hypothetical protein
MERGQRPVDDAVERVEDPFPADGTQCDGRRPGEQDQEAQEPLAAEIAHQEVGQHAGRHEDDRLGGEDEDEGVDDGTPEDRVAPLAPEVLQADEVSPKRSGGGIGKAQIYGEQERAAHQRQDEDDRGCDQRGRQQAPLIAAATPSQPSDRDLAGRRFHPSRS